MKHFNEWLEATYSLSPQAEKMGIQIMRKAKNDLEKIYNQIAAYLYDKNHQASPQIDAELKRMKDLTSQACTGFLAKNSGLEITNMPTSY